MKPVRRSLMNVLLIAAVMAGLGLIATSAGASAPPTQLSYQGLVKVAGAPFSGTGYFKFAIADAATGDGASYWLTGPETLTVSNGLFDFMLGSTTPLPSSVFDNDPIYLRVWFSQAAIGPFQPLEPNQRIGSAAYAPRAEHAATADDASKLGGLTASDYLTTAAGDARYPTLDANGIVPIVRIPPIPWSQLTSVPPGFADGVDDAGLQQVTIGSNLAGNGTAGSPLALASPLSTDLAMGSHRVTGLVAPTASGDAANKSYVDGAILNVVTTKADKTYVDAALATKASTAYVDTADATKLNLSGGTVSGGLNVGGTLGVSGSTSLGSTLYVTGGRAGIGTSTPGFTLHVNGTAAANSFQTLSSRRWKTNIAPIENAVDKVQQLRGVTYDWKETGKHEIGLIAEEVGQVFPEVVTYEDNGVDAKSVDYARLVAVLIQGMKEQQATIDAQQQAIEDLNRRLAELESRVTGGGQ